MYGSCTDEPGMWGSMSTIITPDSIQQSVVVRPSGAAPPDEAHVDPLLQGSAPGDPSPHPGPSLLWNMPSIATPASSPATPAAPKMQASSSGSKRGTCRPSSVGTSHTNWAEQLQQVVREIQGAPGTRQGPPAAATNSLAALRAARSKRSGVMPQISAPTSVFYLKRQKLASSGLREHELAATRLVGYAAEPGSSSSSLLAAGPGKSPAAGYAFGAAQHMMANLGAQQRHITRSSSGSGKVTSEPVLLGAGIPVTSGRLSKRLALSAAATMATPPAAAAATPPAAAAKTLSFDGCSKADEAAIPLLEVLSPWEAAPAPAAAEQAGLLVEGDTVPCHTWAGSGSSRDACTGWLEGGTEPLGVSGLSAGMSDWGLASLGGAAEYQPPCQRPQQHPATTTGSLSATQVSAGAVDAASGSSSEKYHPLLLESLDWHGTALLPGAPFMALQRHPSDVSRCGVTTPGGGHLLDMDALYPAAAAAAAAAGGLVPAAAACVGGEAGADGLTTISSVQSVLATPNQRSTAPLLDSVGLGAQNATTTTSSIVCIGAAGLLDDLEGSSELEQVLATWAHACDAPPDIDAAALQGWEAGFQLC